MDASVCVQVTFDQVFFRPGCGPDAHMIASSVFLIWPVCGPDARTNAMSVLVSFSQCVGLMHTQIMPLLCSRLFRPVCEPDAHTYALSHFPSGLVLFDPYSVGCNLAKEVWVVSFYPGVWV